MSADNEQLALAVAPTPGTPEAEDARRERDALAAAVRAGFTSLGLGHGLDGLDLSSPEGLALVADRFRRQADAYFTADDRLEKADGAIHAHLDAVGRGHSKPACFALDGLDELPDELARLRAEVDRHRDANDRHRDHNVALRQEVAGLRAELDAARAILRRVEWSAVTFWEHESCCPVCGRGKPGVTLVPAGHKPGCALAVLLAADPAPSPADAAEAQSRAKAAPACDNPACTAPHVIRAGAWYRCLSCGNAMPATPGPELLATDHEEID
jgi:hypothetical protein